MHLCLAISVVLSQFRTEFTTLQVTERRGGVVNGTETVSVFPSRAVTVNERVWTPGSKSRKFRRNDKVPVYQTNIVHDTVELLLTYMSGEGVRRMSMLLRSQRYSQPDSLSSEILQSPPCLNRSLYIRGK